MTTSIVGVEPIVVFPAEVTLPDDRVVSPAKVGVSHTRVVVWAEPGTVVFSQLTAGMVESFDLSKPRRDQRMIVATDGGRVIVRKTGGCGCGLALKRLDVRSFLRATP